MCRSAGAVLNLGGTTEAVFRPIGLKAAIFYFMKIKKRRTVWNFQHFTEQSL